MQTKVKKDEQATGKSYCSCGMSWCPLGPKKDSRSDAECPAASAKQTNKRKNSRL